MEAVALLSQYSVVISNKELVPQFAVDELDHVKSGAWDDNGVFIYTTLIHIKYCLPGGHRGIIRALDVPLYITKVNGNIIHCLDREGKNRDIDIDSTEYVFKLSLLTMRYDQVMSMIRSSDLPGRAVIAYLQWNGFPEVALHLVEDERSHFNLAIESDNMQIAVASAKEIHEKDHWYRLGVEALHQGNVGVAKYAYQMTENSERLSFLYLITGNLNKLNKMLNIAQIKNNVTGQFHDALYLGDISERVKILENAGQLLLAYVTAAVHGLRETAESLAAELGENVPSLPAGKSRSSLLLPPSPMAFGGDWPLVRVVRGKFEGGLDNVGRNAAEEDKYEEAEVAFRERIRMLLPGMPLRGI